MKIRNFTFLFVILFCIIGISASYAQYDNDTYGTGLAPSARIMNPLPPSVSNPDILAWNSRAFGYQAIGTRGPIKFFLNSPTNLTLLTTDPGANFLCAGSFDNAGNWWGIRYGTYEVYKIDTTAGTMTQMGTMTGGNLGAHGMAYDWTTNNMYVMSSNGTTFQLGTLNLSTFVWTPIGSPVSSFTLIGLACDNSGQIWGHRFVSGYGISEIVKINKTTNAITVVGPTGFVGWYAQDMSCDHSVDSLYLAAYNYTTSQGELRKVNPATGATTQIGLLGPGSSSEVDCFAIPGAPGPTIAHTPLGNTEQTSGVRAVNCVITPQGSPINPASTKLLWSKNNTTFTDSTLMTNSSGNNWTANLTLSGAGLYRYQIKTADMLGRAGMTGILQFTAGADTSKPVIVHTPLGNVPKPQWPATVSATVTDNIGLDSVWVRWYKNNTGTGIKHFKLLNTTGNNFAAAFNSTQAEVAFGDSIFYRIFARDNSSAHNMDSTALNKFKIISQVTVTIGTGTTANGWPYYTFYMDSRTQMLYTKTELKAGGVTSTGTISQIGFDVVSAAAQIMNGFKISMQTIPDSSLPASAFLTTGWTTVYNTPYSVPGTGWQMITLTTPYYWNGTGSLVVEICFDNSSYTSNTTVNSTANTLNQNKHNHTDLSSGNGCTDITTVGSTYTARPNARFVVDLPVNIPENPNGIPGQFSLYQNYPNPFNPVTQIRFDIPKQTMVTLRIYDVLGREVQKLVNEVRPAGSYIVDFNATGLSSGVYFYKLEAGDYSNVKRMMLIK